MKTSGYAHVKKLSLLPAFLLSVAFIIPDTAFPQWSISAGTTFSTFYYSGSPLPWKQYDIDLRPYVGYDIEWVQLHSQKPRVSPFLGIYYQLPLFSRISLCSGLFLQEKGVDFSNTEYESILYRIRIPYVGLPLSIKYHLWKGNQAEWDVSIGFSGNLSLGARKIVSVNYEPARKTTLQSVKRVEGASQFGITYKRNICQKWILFNLHVFIGHTNIFREPKEWTSLYQSTQQTKFTGIQISFGYEF